MQSSPESRAAQDEQTQHRERGPARRGDDRRVRRTRARLHEALIELMIERGYDRISVADILTRADVGRSTFYAHFRDKDDLLIVSSTEYLTATFVSARPDPDDPHAPPVSAPLAPVYTLFATAAQNPEIYRVLLGAQADAALLRAARGMVARILTERLTGSAEIGDEELATAVTFLSWGVVGLLAMIAESDPPIEVADAYRRLEQMVAPGIDRLCGPGRRAAADPTPTEPVGEQLPRATDAPTRSVPLGERRRVLSDGHGRGVAIDARGRVVSVDDPESPIRP